MQVPTSSAGYAPASTLPRLDHAGRLAELLRAAQQQENLGVASAGIAGGLERRDIIEVSTNTRALEALRPFLNALNEAGSLEEFRQALADLRQFIGDNELRGDRIARLNQSLDYIERALEDGAEGGLTSFNLDISFSNFSISGDNYQSESLSFSIDFSLQTDDTFFRYESEISQDFSSGNSEDGSFFRLSQRDYQSVTLITTAENFLAADDSEVRLFQSLATRLLGVLPKELIELALGTGGDTFNASKEESYIRQKFNNIPPITLYTPSLVIDGGAHHFETVQQQLAEWVAELLPPAESPDESVDS